MSLSSAREASAAQRMTWSAGMLFTLKGSPSVSLFWVRVPVLSEHSTSTPASSSIADNRVTMASFFASRRAPTAMVTDSTVGMATGIAATRSTRQNSNVVRTLVATEERDNQDQHDQSHREHDQVVANLQYGTLEMADGMSFLDQLRGLAEVGVRPGGVHHGVDFALAEDRPRKHCPARFAVTGKDSPVNAD